jgi:hypothetical protein
MLAGLVDLTVGETEKNDGDAQGLLELQEHVKSNQGLSLSSLGAVPPSFGHRSMLRQAHPRRWTPVGPRTHAIDYTEMQ